MGKFFNTLHVKSSNREAFITGFEWIMKKEGFVPCADADEAEVTFAAAFSEGGWVSLSNGDDSAVGLFKLSERLAKDLLLPSFTVEAVDSDFAIIELCSPDKKTKIRKSRLVVGDGEGFGVEKAPILLDDWKPLFQNGGAEEFLAAAGQDGVFVEDALCELGKILGIKPAVMAWCHDEFEEKIGRGGEVISLAFKKKAEKKLTLNAAFKRVFGEALAPLGYRLIKGKYPYFVRVVSDEIIHVISYYNDKKCYDRDHDYIQIKGGVATVYRPEIDLTKNPKWENWLTTNCDIYIYRLEHNLEERDDELKRQLYNHPSLPDEILKGMEYQLALTKRFILPALDKAMTIDSCIENDFEIRMSLTIYDDGSFGTTEGNGYFDEGMLYFKTDRSAYENITKNAVNEGVLRERAYFEKVHSDPELYGAVQAELERRKKENTEKLRSYGLDI